MKTLKQMAREPQNNFPKQIVVHHTAGSMGFDGIQKMHIYQNGWDNIGYHWLIERDGTVKQGRPETYNGAHAIGANFDSVGIALVGHFNHYLPSDAQIKALRKLLKEVMERHNIPPENIYPHRKFQNKDCYGTLLDDDWARKLVEDNECVCLEEANISELIQELLSRF